MTFRPLSVVFAASSCLFALILAGCGGSGGGAPGGSDDWTLLQDAGRKWDAIDGSDLGAATDQMVEWLRAQPQVKEAGVSDGIIVWARLQDDTYAGWSDDHYLNGGRATHLMPDLPRKSGSGRSVPRGRMAYLFHSDLFALDPERASSDIRPQLRSILETAGYTVVTAKGTLDDFKKIDPGSVALLWTNTHGDMFPAVPGPVTAGKRYYMASSTTVSQRDFQPGSPYYADVQQRRLLPLKEKNQPYFYWFSTDWLKDNVSFGQGTDAVWVNSACKGAMTSEMSDAAFSRGLSAYLGWNESVLYGAANDAALYAIDRMAGSNKQSPIPSPPQRPFDLASVYADMARQSPDLTKSQFVIPWLFRWNPDINKKAVSATLKTVANPTSSSDGDEGFKSLNPSIDHMTVTSDGAQTYLELYGIFGSRQAQVTIGGVGLGVASNGWTPDHIRCILPAPDQPGAYGDVVVTVDAHQSNPAALTMWEITLRQTQETTWDGTKYELIRSGDLIQYEEDAGSERTDVSSKIWVRGDIHSHRSIPGSAPIPVDELPFVLSTQGRGTKEATIDSLTTTGSATATLTTNRPGDRPIIVTDTFSNAGSARVPLDGSDPRAENGTIDGRVFVANKQLGLVYNVLLHNVIKVDIKSDPPDAGSVDLSGSDTGVAFSTPRFELDDSFNIKAGSKDETGGTPSKGQTIRWHTEWSGRVFNPPSPNTARSARTSRSR